MTDVPSDKSDRALLLKSAKELYRGITPFLRKMKLDHSAKLGRHRYEILKTRALAAETQGWALCVTAFGVASLEGEIPLPKIFGRKVKFSKSEWKGLILAKCLCYGDLLRNQVFRVKIFDLLHVMLSNILIGCPGIFDRHGKLNKISPPRPCPDPDHVIRLCCSVMGFPDPAMGAPAGVHALLPNNRTQASSVTTVVSSTPTGVSAPVPNSRTQPSTTVGSKNPVRNNRTQWSSLIVAQSKENNTATADTNNTQAFVGGESTTGVAGVHLPNSRGAIFTARRDDTLPAPRMRPDKATATGLPLKPLKSSEGMNQSATSAHGRQILEQSALRAKSHSAGARVVQQARKGYKVDNEDIEVWNEEHGGALREEEQRKAHFFKLLKAGASRKDLLAVLQPSRTTAPESSKMGEKVTTSVRNGNDKVGGSASARDRDYVKSREDVPYDDGNAAAGTLLLSEKSALQKRSLATASDNANIHGGGTRQGVVNSPRVGEFVVYNSPPGCDVNRDNDDVKDDGQDAATSAIQDHAQSAEAETGDVNNGNDDINGAWRDEATSGSVVLELQLVTKFASATAGGASDSTERIESDLAQPLGSINRANGNGDDADDDDPINESSDSIGVDLT